MPSITTVQTPQVARLQLRTVPVSPIFSEITSHSVVRASCSTVCGVPLRLKVEDIAVIAPGSGAADAAAGRQHAAAERRQQRRRRDRARHDAGRHARLDEVPAGEFRHMRFPLYGRRSVGAGRRGSLRPGPIRSYSSTEFTS